MTVNVDGNLARKVVPGIEGAYAIHQLSENNNCNVLSKALVHDMGVASNAIKDMAKMSKKMVVHTGTLGV
jgi:hypothetical protein